MRAPTEWPLRIVLHPRSSISGRVVDEDEKPVAHAPVAWELQRSGQDASWMAAGESVAADGDGRFLLRDVLPGSIALHVHAPGFQPAELDDLEVPPGKDVEGVEIVLRRGAAVAGRVLDAEGEPEVGALVEVAPQRGAAAMQVFNATPTDGDGRYRLEGVEPGGAPSARPPTTAAARSPSSMSRWAPRTPSTCVSKAGSRCRARSSTPARAGDGCDRHLHQAGNAARVAARLIRRRRRVSLEGHVGR